jgi:hypothetical protein
MWRDVAGDFETKETGAGGEGGLPTPDALVHGETLTKT